MMTRYILVPAILGCAAMLYAPDVAFAQRGGRGGGRGGFSTARVSGTSMAGRSTSAYRGGTYYHNGNVYHSGAYYHNGVYYHNGAYYHNGNYYHNGYNYGAFYPGFVFGAGLYAPFYPSAYAWDVGVAPRVAFYPSDGIVDGQPPIQDTPKNAQIKVLLPDPNAKVWFDGSPTTSTGTDRLYYTPDLTANVAASYRIRATWLANGKEITQERVVGVAPGRGTVIDFTRPASEGVPPPAKK